MTPSALSAGSLIEFRLLDGPNLYFPKPAAKVTVDVRGVLDLVSASQRGSWDAWCVGSPRSVGPSGSVSGCGRAGR